MIELKKSGRPPKPHKERCIRFSIALPPNLARYLKSKLLYSRYIQGLLTEDMDKKKGVSKVRQK